MLVTVNGKPVHLSEHDLLGVGGEADVYSHGNLAIKIYRGLDATALKLRGRKLAAFPRLRTARVLGPVATVCDAQARCVGFAMARLEGGREFGALCRARSPLSMSETIDVLVSLHEVLRSLHSEHVVVGDLNDGNVLVKGRSAFLIDCDSMQLGQFGCPVAHERTLAPELYGRDLTAGPAFSEQTDWYAFGVLAVSALLGTHPYGGTHPHYGTMLRRAEAGVSIVASEVTYPRAARPLGALPDAWLTWIAATFDRGERGVFPLDLLRTKFVRCDCGVEHARSQCPSCSTHTQVPVVRVTSTCTARQLVKARGPLVAVDPRMPVRYAALVNRKLVRETGEVVCDLPDGFARAIAVSSRLYVTTTDHFWCYRGSAVECEGSLASFQGEAAIDANDDGAFGVRDGFLLELHSGRRLGQLLDGLSWVRVGQSLGFALCRTGQFTHAFIFRTKGGSLSKSEFPHLPGKLVSLGASFDQNHIVVSLALDANGRREHHLVMLAADGSLIAHSHEAGAALDADAGRCVAWGAVLTATDDGLVLLRARPGQPAQPGQPGRLEEERRFPESREWVSHGATLILGPQGSVFVVSGNTLVQLSMS